MTPAGRAPDDPGGTADAVRWVVGLLERLAVPYRAVGGLAARAYGSARALADLDFYVPDVALARLHTEAAGRATGAPGRVRGEHWDVTVLALDVAGQRIELGGADGARYRRSARHPWHGANADLDRGVVTELLGTTVRVMPKDELVAYKTVLSREVDLIDLHYLTGAGGCVDARLAVYGTLAPGEVNYHVIRDLEGAWTDGFVSGRMHAVGWGTTHGFPGMIWDPDAERQPVRLLTSEALPAHWERLDRFEGPAYTRALVPVAGPDGPVIANIYLVSARV